MSGLVPPDPVYTKKSFSYLRTRHPVILGIAIACLPPAAYLLWKVPQMDPQRDFVKKYKIEYIVIRPDDPLVKMVRTGPIGLDRLTKANP